MIHDSHKLIVILGPTASGKTEWGIKLAKKFNGEVICADSRTVYKYLNIATAKPKGRNYGRNVEKNLGCRNVQRVSHYLLDFIDPKKIYTVADFQRDANKAIELIFSQGKQPIVVGGSALYIYALTEGYKFPGKSDRKLRRELELKSLVELQAIVKKYKKTFLNSSDFQNKRRLIRAIEVNKNYKLKIKNCFSSPIPYSILKIGIDLPREEVYQRIDKRTNEWMAEGLIAEVRRLMRIGVSRKRINEFGLGYREVIKYLKGKIKNKDELTERINFTQHAYVRRQMTWFRRDKEIKWLKNIKEAMIIIKKFLST